MFSTDSIAEPSRRQLRQFGLILAVGFLAIGLSPLLLHGRSLRLWAIALSFAFGTAGTFFPAGLRPIRTIWMAFGRILGWINTRLILGVVYYAMLTPLRLLLKIVGRDPMNRSFDEDRESYRVLRKPRPAVHMKNQF